MRVYEYTCDCCGKDILNPQSRHTIMRKAGVYHNSWTLDLCNDCIEKVKALAVYKKINDERWRIDK